MRKKLKKAFIREKSLEDISLRDIVDFSVILLIIWILYQLISLFSIKMINFFSWTQVINDTAILAIPILLLCLWIRYWYKLTKNLKELEKNKKIKEWKRIVILIMLVIIPIGIKFRLTKWKTLESSLYLYYLIGFLFPWISYGILYKYTIDEIIESWYKDIINILYIVLLLWTSIVSEINWSLYKEIYLINNDQTEQKVEYMNDKYIFIKYNTWIKIINKLDNMSFIKKLNVENIEEKKHEFITYPMCIDFNKYNFIWYNLWYNIKYLTINKEIFRFFPIHP